MLTPPAIPNPDVAINTIQDDGDPSKQKLAPPPPALTEQYTVIVNRYYFKDRPNVEAFVDHGDRLRTRHDSPAAVQGMLTLAESRGWDRIKVAGSDAFKQTVWLEGALRGLTITGYQPTAHDQAALAARQQEPAAAPPSAEAALRPATGPAPAPDSAPGATPVPSPASQVPSPAPPPAAPAPSPTAPAPAPSPPDAAPASEQRAARQAAIRDQVLQQSRQERERQAAEVQAAKEQQAAQAEKARQLRDAFNTLDKRRAMQQFPELTRLYPLLAEAHRLAKAHIPDADKRAAFVEGITEKGIQELARGKALPPLASAVAPSSDRSAEKHQEKSREESAEIEP